MFRLALVVLCSAASCYLALMATGGGVADLFDQPTTVAVGISAIIGALSVGFHTFVDGIAKDLPSKDKVVDPKKLEIAIKSLGYLRTEIISNTILVLALLVLFALLMGGSAVLSKCCVVRAEMSWALISLRFSCLASIVYCAIIQLLGFLTATKLRNVLASNR